MVGAQDLEDVDHGSASLGEAVVLAPHHGQELIEVSILLSDDGTELVATAEDVSVSYRPVTDADDVPGCA